MDRKTQELDPVESCFLRALQQAQEQGQPVKELMEAVALGKEIEILIDGTELLLSWAPI